MWTVLYATMGYAAHRVWQAGGGPLPLALYGVRHLTFAMGVLPQPCVLQIQLNSSRWA